jgi:hypothetical protein
MYFESHARPNSAVITGVSLKEMPLPGSQDKPVAGVCAVCAAPQSAPASMIEPALAIHFFAFILFFSFFDPLSGVRIIS